jgi:hypothetical protein
MAVSDRHVRFGQKRTLVPQQIRSGGLSDTTKKKPRRRRGFSVAFDELDYDLVLAVSATHVVLSLSYLNPGAFFSASLVVSIVR